jgi:nucleoside-diphosphate-sugar epimerase
MKILITGAGGFLGAATARAALAAGDEVVCLARGAPPPRLQELRGKVKPLRIDMADEAAVRTALAAERPDAVVHSAWAGLTAGARAGRDQIDGNLLATCRLAAAAADAGVAKFVGIGSQAEYGRLERRVVESDLPQPNSMYGAAKLAAFHLAGETARAAGMRFAWLRLFAAYGPGDNPDWLIPSLIRRMLAGERPQTTLGTQKWDYLYIDDAAEGVLAAVHGDAAGAFNLSSDDPVPVRTVVETIRDLAAPGLELAFGEIPFGPNQIMLMHGANGRLREATGWQPRTALRDGLARTVEAAR